MAAPEQLKGYLVVKVLEVTGKSKEEEAVWDSVLKEAFIKVEVRGGPRTVKKQTATQPVIDSLITIEEDLVLDILDGAKELRIMLCRQRKGDGKPGTSVIAACGIYVNDILEAVPIDKFFDLFKPGQGSEGGFVRVSMSFLTAEQVRGNGALLPAAAEGEGRGARRAEHKAAGKRSGLPLLKVSLAVALGALAVLLVLGKKKGGCAKQDDGMPAKAAANAKKK